MKDTWHAGFGYDFETTVVGFPATAGWTLRFAIVPRTSGGARYDLVSTPAGEKHRTVVASATTAEWAPGEYSTFAYVENGSGERHDASGLIYTEGAPTSLLTRILPNPRTVTSYDGRTPERIALDNVRAWLAGDIRVKGYTIGSRSIEKIPPGELITIRDRLQADVARQDAAAGLNTGQANPRFTYVRFGGGR